MFNSAALNPSKKENIFSEYRYTPISVKFRKVAPNLRSTVFFTYIFSRIHVCTAFSFDNFETEC
ncbi:hypothetical protein EG68_11995 [Paragonimus skrjabini miyazakii]|uniref:Uncharacterized protein n=1 Tax=Paragonimus skrjabini miyazakii TaxID=59628 RepID=A0A8S9YDG2_9TREM|nr:hypothetical protein EG68_11995 [Paragonimus skrjabini miyazakii]